MPEVERDPAKTERYNSCWLRHDAAVKRRDKAAREDVSDEVMAVLDADIVKLREEMDENKYPEDMFHLHLKQIDQEKAKLAKQEA